MSGIYRYLSGNWELSDSAMWWIYSSQPNRYSLFLHLHSSRSVTLEAVLYFKRQGHRGLYMASASPKWIHFYHSKRSFMPICVQSSVMYLSACCSVLFDSVTPWTPACQASLSFTTSQDMLKLMFIDSAMPFNHLILSRPLFLLLPFKILKWTILNNNCRA